MPTAPDNDSGSPAAAPDTPPRTVRSLRLVIVTDSLAPYRVPIYNRIAATPGIVFRAIYASQGEPEGRWDLPAITHDHVFLAGTVSERTGRFMHRNPDVWDSLRAFDPDVVVTTGHNRTHILAYLYARLYRRKHVVMTDGTDTPEARLSPLRRWTRRVVFAGSASFIAASQSGWRLLRAYGVLDRRIHFSPLCANAAVNWDTAAKRPRDVDLLFSDGLVEVKNAGFAMQVAQGVARKLDRQVSLALLGHGPQEKQLRQSAATMAADVDVQFGGHASQAELPGWFLGSRLFLFPTRLDPWGVVANEACMAGVPVLVSPHAGAANELVMDGVNGRVLPLERDLWVDTAAKLLADPVLHARYAAAARASVEPYSFENAALGIVDAARQAVAPRGESPPRLNRYRRRARVVCVQRRLPHYRLPLFEGLRQALSTCDVDFVLVHGEPMAEELAKKDSGHLPWAQQMSTRYWFKGKLCWQDPSVAVAGADLVIVPQENRLLYNLLAMTVRAPARLAFWGHGRNFQSPSPNGWRERFKAWSVGYVDWWFTYTELSTDYVRERGFPAERITTLNNSIDTARLVTWCASVQLAETQGLREQLGVGSGPVGLFIGSLYPDKRIGFLLEAAGLIAAQVPGFHLLVVGDGPDCALVEEAAANAPWLRYLGVRLGRDKAVCLKTAQLMLNPGLVGLGILDAFAAAVPMISTDCHLHSPEIAYLRHGENGLMTEDSVPAFVGACVELLQDEQRRRHLADGAAHDARRYTLARMVDNFRDGILAALKTPAKR